MGDRLDRRPVDRVQLGDCEQADIGVLEDEGTGQVTIWFAALPQTKYTIEVTFDVANGSSTSVPYKPHVTITEAFAANLDITQAQPSYSFSDPDLGAATWSVDQSVVWAPRVYRMTEVAYAPVPVVSSVYTYIDNYNQMAEPANVDSVSADSTLSGKLTWYAAMCSETDSPLPTPSISVDQSSQTFTPPLSFPLATAPQSTLAGGGCFNLNKLDGGTNGSVVDNVATTSGFDLSRTMSPATIAAGGDTQTVQVSLTPRASGNEEVWMEVMTGYVPGATVDSASVVWPTLGNGEQFGYTNVGPNSAAVTIENPVVGKTYTLTVGIQVANATSAARTFKPDVSGGAGFHVNVDAGGSPADGPSTTVHDDLLGGTFTFSFGTPIHWTHNLFREKTVDLAGQWTGGPEANVGVIRYTDVMTRCFHRLGRRRADAAGDPQLDRLPVERRLGGSPGSEDQRGRKLGQARSARDLPALDHRRRPQAVRLALPLRFRQHRTSGPRRQHARGNGIRRHADDVADGHPRRRRDTDHDAVGHAP